MSCEKGNPVHSGLKLLSVILLLSLAIPLVSAASGPLPDNNNLYIETVNAPLFDDYGNGTYWFWFPDDAGLNTLHITDDYTDSYGQVTTTADMAGSFYVTDTGGMKYKDDIILMLAVNGSVDDNFSVNLRCNGYQWTPNVLPHTAPDEGNVTYVKDCLLADFTKDDFLSYNGKNIKQNWKIFNTSDYPIYYGQDVSDTDNTFKLMFVDLHAGVLNADKLGYSELKNGGSVKVNYEFQNLGDCYAAFNVYAYSKRPEYDDRSLDNTTQWTNRLNDDAGRTVSGYSVWSLFAPQVTSIKITPEDMVISPDSTLQLSAVGLDQGGNEIPGLTFEWRNDNPLAGWIDSDGLYTTTHLGISNITATYENISGTTRVVVSPDVTPIYVAADSSGNYTTITDAVTFAHENTEIIVQDGTYSESVEVPRTLFIHSENGPDATILDLSALPETTGGFILNADGVNVSGFTITGASEGFAVTFNEASDSILFNNVIAGNTDGIFLNAGDNNTIVGNVIDCPESDDHYALRIKKNSGDNTIFQNSFVSGDLKKASGSTGNLWNSLDIYQYSYDDGQSVYQGSSQTGNYWSAYAGVSGNTPGIGDAPYDIPDVGSDNYPLTAPIGNFTFGAPIPAGDTFYVGAGEDFTSIQSAVDAANANYTIIVRDGTYAESVTIDKALTVTSENGPGAAILQSAGYRGFEITADSVTLNGMTITNTTTESGSGAVYLFDASDCVITNNTANGDGLGIVLDGDSDNNLVTENTVRLNTNDKRMLSIKSAECENNRISENVFAGGKTPKDEGTGTMFWTASPVVNYVYEGHQSTSYFGNYWVDADTTDVDMNGIADNPYTPDKSGVIDNYPLVSSDLSEYCRNGDYTGDVILDVPLNVPECTFTGEVGSQSVVVDNSTGSAFVFENGIALDENGFTFVINTVNYPGGNTTVITGVVESIEVIISPISTQFDDLGGVRALIGVDLTELPAGSELDSMVNRSVSAGDLTTFEGIAAANGLIVGDIAYTYRVVKSAGLDIYVEDAEIIMMVDSGWVDAHGGPSKIRILRIADSGAGQVLETSYYGPSDGQYVFLATSPDGLSLFGLSSATSVVTPSGGSGGGGSGSTSVAANEDIRAGEEALFGFKNSAIYEISLVTKEDVDEVMLTAKKGDMPNGAEAPSGDVYQYVSITVYKADPAAIEKATLRFSVDSSAFAGGYDPARTELMYYDEGEGVWAHLSTVPNGEKNGVYDYFADSAKLCNFAIVLNNYVASEEALFIEDETENPPGLDAESSAPSENDMLSSDDTTENVPPTTSGNLLSCIISVIGAVGVAGLASQTVGRRKNE